ncbi:uncharacterized protein UTRI_10427 [Ustilago trichophora]|uniref:Uncharacterized protein n=1 Tax=Ustilago trichophora TaxID=86804 RepID=A0A5C3EAU7_9BASI|nr:uncharacterized protein UTRI_10427 [Ustilago trichophora]
MRVFNFRTVKFLFVAFTTLAGSPFAFASGPELSELEQQMYSKAREIYANVPAEANIEFQEGQDLKFYEAQFPELRTKLHEGVRGGPAILVGQHESPAVPKTNFYATVIFPRTRLGSSIGLPASPGNPFDRTAFAFWKHQGDEIKLLRMDTALQTGAKYNARPLVSLIPLNEVTKIL